MNKIRIKHLLVFQKFLLEKPHLFRECYNSCLFNYYTFDYLGYFSYCYLRSLVLGNTCFPNVKELVKFIDIEIQKLKK